MLQGIKFFGLPHARLILPPQGTPTVFAILTKLPSDTEFFSHTSWASRQEQLTLNRTPNSALSLRAHVHFREVKILISFNSQQPSTYAPPSILLSNTEQSLEPQPAPESPSEPEVALPNGRQALRVALADRSDLQKLAQALLAAFEKLPANAGPTDVIAVLKENRVAIHPNSSFRRDQNLMQPSVSLEAFIQSKGTYMPTTGIELQDLAGALIDHTLTHPLGNFAGALSWANPLSEVNQRKVLDVVRSNNANLHGLPLINPRWGALDYLAGAVRLSTTDMQDPAKALEKLLDSNRSQALGEAIQRTLGSIPTDRSANEGILAAIHLGLDPESIDRPVRNHVAGFNLAADTYWNRAPADVVSALAEHLRSRTSVPELGARVLLARVAPQFLVKDIPEGVNIGTQAWANLCLAVARVEADSPGKTASMSFGEVMRDAETKLPASESTQKAVLIDWAVANQVVAKYEDEEYTAEVIEHARSVFNQQHSDVKAASELLDIPMPDRKAMALDLLKKKWGDGIDFEQKILRINYGPETRGMRFSDPYSMLDVTMQGLKLHDSWQVFGTNTLDLEAFTAFTHSNEFNIPAAFNTAFDNVTDHYKAIKKNLIMNAITHAPLEDRDQFNFGELRFFTEKSYMKSSNPFVSDRLFHTSKTIRVEAKREGKIQSYAFDTEKGTLQRIPADQSSREPKNDVRGPEVVKFEEYYPDAANRNVTVALEHSRRPPNHFRNSRVQQVAATVVKGLEIDSDSVKRQAAGRTGSEKRTDTLDSIGNFLLDLIPFRSAIVNFQKGNYKDGITDLAFDVFGLVTAGVGTVAKVVSGASKGGSALASVLRATRIIGANTLSALNPLSGVGDLAIGAGKLTLAGASAVGEGVQRLRGMAYGSDLVDASYRFDAAATGIINQGGRRLEGSAVQHEGKWFAFDSGQQQPYGPPLEDFTPRDVLMPPSPRTRHSARYNPISRPARPKQPDTRPREPLPSDEYATSASTNGALISDHFAADRLPFTREKFTLEMNGFYKDMAAGGMPPRPVIPDITASTRPNEMIADALTKTDVLVFGENHSEVASLVLMRDAMKTFKDSGVNAIYLEAATLDAYGLIADAALANNIKNRAGGSTIYDELKKAADEFDIELMPLEHRYLTRHSDNPGYFSPLDTLPKSSTAFKALSKQRLEEMNYYGARQVMKNELGGKSVVWVGRAHMNTSEGVPGIAELTGGIGISVYQNAAIPQSAVRKANVPRVPSSTLSGSDMSAGDLQIDVKV
ncbi:hypothetical protein EJ576_11000 [Pseudomonas sp. C 49-2]|uniref:membrane-targeted effector domain-containing toxin n=1 Tax=Pseudomonas sp. C 49-2 TaxID=2496849 RepID=UPI000F82F0D8|nr:membrane-targeted effector domain-containing toxin [Pseudomonas sp. C 49-2]RTY00821.1 hypothetical protein EJ576_11000 [Pseudomonas sp. C 49-2]